MNGSNLGRTLVVVAVACASTLAATGDADAVSAQPTHAAKATTHIAGRIVDQAGHPLAGVVVTADSDISFSSHSARTNRSGRYSVASSPGTQ
jgi:hypothetical protein